MLLVRRGATVPNDLIASFQALEAAFAEGLLGSGGELWLNKLLVRRILRAMKGNAFWLAEVLIDKQRESVGGQKRWLLKNAPVCESGAANPLLSERVKPLTRRWSKAAITMTGSAFGRYNESDKPCWFAKDTRYRYKGFLRDEEEVATRSRIRRCSL